mmetsp:Transcript_71844/g.138829  ORF Transcript_71844/g.138829 Transcript_71844/m.138829 type:complete len:103 (+) Transcript_71844:325-633(+)
MRSSAASTAPATSQKVGDSSEKHDKFLLHLLLQQRQQQQQAAATSFRTAPFVRPHTPSPMLRAQHEIVLPSNSINEKGLAKQRSSGCNDRANKYNGGVCCTS